MSTKSDVRDPLSLYSDCSAAQVHDTDFLWADESYKGSWCLAR